MALTPESMASLSSHSRPALLKDQTKPTSFKILLSLRPPFLAGSGDLSQRLMLSGQSVKGPTRGLPGMNQGPTRGLRASPQGSHPLASTAQFMARSVASGAVAAQPAEKAPRTEAMANVLEGPLPRRPYVDDPTRSSYDMQIAEKAVQLACWLTQRVQQQLRKQEESAQSKADKSFVTVADYGVQAVVSWVLTQAYPGETISMVAEEDTKDLTGEAGIEVLQRLVSVVNECLEQTPRLGIPPPARPLTAVEILSGISRGSSEGGPTGRHWVLDPVDGTLGFVRQDQYAVALALIQDGELQLGVLGCPNFPTRSAWLRHPHRFHRLTTTFFPPEPRQWVKGFVMKAQRGQGAFMEPLVLGPGVGANSALANGQSHHDIVQNDPPIVVQVSPVQDPVAAVFCEPVEKANSNQGFTGLLASSLGMKSEALRMYSMAKYAAVARGDAEIFMKFAKSTYKEKIWDHAAGVIIVEEAGGVVTDAGGKPLDFSQGRFLTTLDRGIIASSGPRLHQALLREVENSWGSSSL